MPLSSIILSPCFCSPCSYPLGWIQSVFISVFFLTSWISHIHSSNSPVWSDTVSNLLFTCSTEVLLWLVWFSFPYNPPWSSWLFPSTSSCLQQTFDLVENTYFLFLAVIYFSWRLLFLFSRVTCFLFCFSFKPIVFADRPYLPHFLFLRKRESSVSMTSS